MPYFDLPLEKLKEYRPSSTRQPDFDAFWERTLDQASSIPLDPKLELIDYPAEGVVIGRASYAGWDGATIRGLYLCPEGEGPFPGIVFYHGYSGSKGAVYDYLGWVYQGYAVLAVDCRGQNGDSEDSTDYPTGHLKGWMTLGIFDPNTYYYRGVFVDSVRALDYITGRDEVDSSRVGITGISQGGGLTLAVAALDDRPKVAMADVPFLCHYERASQITDQYPYFELVEFCRSRPGAEGTAFKTLSYFDGMNLAPKIGCPTLISVGLYDMICPPSTVFAAYNNICAKKEIRIYPYGIHAVSGVHWEEKLRYASRYLKGK